MSSCELDKSLVPILQSCLREGAGPSRRLSPLLPLLIFALGHTRKPRLKEQVTMYGGGGGRAGHNCRRAALIWEG